MKLDKDNTDDIEYTLKSKAFFQGVFRGMVVGIVVSAAIACLIWWMQ